MHEDLVDPQHNVTDREPQRVCVGAWSNVRDYKVVPVRTFDLHELEPVIASRLSDELDCPMMQTRSRAQDEHDSK